MGDEPDLKKMPEFKIEKEQMENLKVVAAITKMFSEDPDLVSEIAKIFKEVAEEKDRELVDKVTNHLAKRAKELSPEKLKAAFNFWYICYLPPETMQAVWHTFPWQVYPATAGPKGWHT